MVKITLKFIGLIIIVSNSLVSSELNIYSPRHYDADKKLFKKFTQKTGIKVNVVKAKSEELIKRLESEGKYSKADLLFTVDVGNLVIAQKKGLFQPIFSKKISNNIPTHLRQKDGYWFGLTKRARLIVYNKNNIDPEELSTYAALTDKKWYKRLLVRKSTNIYNQSLVASFIASDGEETTRKWMEGIVKNMARTPRGNDRDQMKAIAAGIADIAIVNSYYVGNLLYSSKPNEVEVGKLIGVHFPNQGVGERGTHINISGVGVTAHAKNKENAILFIEFLSGEEAQRIYAQTNFEYPVNTKVRPSDLLISWGEFKEDSLFLERYGEFNSDAVRLFNKVGWN